MIASQRTEPECKTYHETKLIAQGKLELPRRRSEVKKNASSLSEEIVAVRRVDASNADTVRDREGLENENKQRGGQWYSVGTFCCHTRTQQVGTKRNTNPPKNFAYKRVRDTNRPQSYSDQERAEDSDWGGDDVTAGSRRFRDLNARNRRDREKHPQRAGQVRERTKIDDSADAVGWLTRVESEIEEGVAECYDFRDEKLVNSGEEITKIADHCCGGAGGFAVAAARLGCKARLSVFEIDGLTLTLILNTIGR